MNTRTDWATQQGSRSEREGGWGRGDSWPKWHRLTRTDSDRHGTDHGGKMAKKSEPLCFCHLVLHPCLPGLSSLTCVPPASSDDASSRRGHPTPTVFLPGKNPNALLAPAPSHFLPPSQNFNLFTRPVSNLKLVCSWITNQSLLNPLSDSPQTLCHTRSPT